MPHVKPPCDTLRLIDMRRRHHDSVETMNGPLGNMSRRSSLPFIEESVHSPAFLWREHFAEPRFQLETITE